MSGPLADANIDEDMASDWNAILERGSADADPEPATPAAEPAAAAQVETPTPDAEAGNEGDASGDRARDAKGRFEKDKPRSYRDGSKRREAAPKEPAAEAAAAADPNAQPQPNADAQPARDLSRAPSTWRPTARAEFGKLPEVVRAEIHKREGDFMAGQAQLLGDAKFGKTISEIVAPYRMLIESEGGTPEKAVGDLMRTAAILRTGTQQQKYQTFANIARNYGIDMRAFLPRPPAPGAQPGQPGPGPGTVPPQPQFRDPRVDELLQRMQSDEQRRAAAENEQTLGLVNNWMAEVDEKGQSKRPYLGDVLDSMSAMIPQIRAANPSLTHAQCLEKAYESAAWAHPEVRQLLQREQQAKLDTQRRAENQQRAAGARRAASVNVPRRGSTPTPAKPGTLEETIASTARELGIIGG